MTFASGKILENQDHCIGDKASLEQARQGICQVAATPAARSVDMGLNTTIGIKIGVGGES